MGQHHPSVTPQHQLITPTLHDRIPASWLHHRRIDISGPDGLTDYQVRLTLQGTDPAAEQYFPFAEAEPDGADIRLLDSDDETMLPYWIERWDAAAKAAIIWVKIPTIPRTIFLYWGKPGAACTSNGDDTFAFFDDFETALLKIAPTNIPLGGEPAAFCEEDADHIDLWYSGPGNVIHYAASTDGITFDSCPTDIPAGFLRSTVLKVDGLYYLYCADNDHHIHLFTSDDKVHFTPQGVALAGNAAGDLYVANMFVWVEDGAWYMLYEAMREGQDKFVICLATSASPTGFSSGRDPGNPIMTAPGAGCGNPELARIGSRVLRLGGKYYLFYHRLETWRAWSTDLHGWTEEGVVWGYDRTDHVGFSCGDASVCQFRNRTYIWKSLSDQVARCWMVVAIADMPLHELLVRDVPLSAGKWEDTFPDGGYHTFPDIDTTRAHTGKSAIFMKKQYWRDPRPVAISHRFRPSGPIVFTAWFHDDGSSIDAQSYVAIRDTEQANPVWLGVNTTVSATHYVTCCDGNVMASPVERQAGWHKFEFIVREAGTEVSIDGHFIGKALAMNTASMGSIALWNSKDMPMNASIDTITIRQFSELDPAVIMHGGKEAVGLAKEESPSSSLASPTLPAV